jgi:hypothetical protein
LIVTHQRKSLGEFGEAVRGSNALTGGVDVVLEVERPAPSLALGKEARALRAVSRFGSTPDELFVELDLDEATFNAIESPGEVKAAAERSRLLDVLGGLGDATSKQLSERHLERCSPARTYASSASSAAPSMPSSALALSWRYPATPDR